MADRTKDLLAGKEARKSSRIEVLIWKSSWHTILPRDTLRTREKILQKLILVAEFHVDHPVPQARGTSCLRDFVDTSHRFFSVLDGLEFDVAVHCLCSRAFHDDMNGAAFVGTNKAGLSAEEVDDFLLCDGVWDLLFIIDVSQILIILIYTKEVTYVGNLNHSPFLRTLGMDQTANRHLTGQDKLVNSRHPIRRLDKDI